MSGVCLKYLAYFGPGVPVADLKLYPGLNVICGASETGKSFITESIDFMFGQENPVRNIKEQAGYDRVRLLIESEGWPPLTLDRSIEGGNYRAYEEAVFEAKPESPEKVLRWKHSAARQDTLSYELLQRTGLEGKILRKNKRSETRSLSFRDLARLCIVNEEEIQRRSSPLLSGQFTTGTVEYAAFKLLLTGTDDSALVSEQKVITRNESASGKIELLDQMIEELQSDLDEQGLEEGELRTQLIRLGNSLEEQRRALENVQKELDEILQSRGQAAAELRDRKARLAEIDELVARFALLDEHYGTDLLRLEAIHESGSLFVHLDRKSCPLCGAAPEHQHLDAECEGDAEAVVQAADAEISKTRRLRQELSDTVSSLKQEHHKINESLAEFQKGYDIYNKQLGEIAAPAVASERASYNELVSNKAEVKDWLEKFDRLHRMKAQRAELDDDDIPSDIKAETATRIPKSTLDEFSQVVERILEEWHFPNAARVFFDESKRDFQIAGKERGSMGKGLRAITHAAVSIGLMEFCREKGLPHPGFVVLDSPLLAYWKPEGEEDDLTGTDLDEMFFRYLLGLHKDNQVIIVENKHPPEFVVKEGHVTVFTKNPHQGRYGFFPVAS